MKCHPSLIKKSALFVFSGAALLASSVATLRAQSALDGFDPHANGAITVIVVQPDGKILLGGVFTTLQPNGGTNVFTRNRIARLNSDGTLDTAFNPNANGWVHSIAVQSDGNILVGGEFGGAANSIGGTNRNYIARLDATTGAADSFDPNPNYYVYAIAVQPDDKILVGGGFNSANSIGGTNRNYIARLDPVTGLADSFNPNADSPVLAITVQADGRILAGGSFGGIGGATRNRIARLDPTTGLADSLFNPNANNSVLSIAVQADGKILAGGFFSGANSIGGAARNRIARLDPTTGLADSFDPNANGNVFAIVIQPDGGILAGGTFNGANGIGGTNRNYIARLDPITGLADSFDPHASDIVQCIAVQQDGKVLAGGNFEGLAPSGGAPVQRKNIARMEAGGRLDQTLELSISSGLETLVYATAIQPDGKILLGGEFTNVLGVTRNNIARLNTDGTLDNAFNPNANSIVYSIAVQADGKILVGGLFNGANSIGGAARNHIARLDATTGQADSFDPNATDTVSSIAVQADGKILVGGYFTSIGGAERHFIARLDATTGAADSFDPDADLPVSSIALQADGKIVVGGRFSGANSIGGVPRDFIARLNASSGAADSFDPGANLYVESIALQADGKILVGGAFNGANSIGGAARNRIARLDATTGLVDAFFNPNANDIVQTIALQADGKILVGGDFGGTNSIGGAARNHIARLNATTGVADSFDPNANSTVYAIAVQPDGKILVGGQFSGATNNIGGTNRNYFARLKNDAIVLQNLAVTQTTITWTHGESILIVSNSTTEIRGGAGPQFSRVTLETSTNNLNYSFLGNGAFSGGNWTLTGLNLPTGQNLYIRARGYYSSGYQNGSESIQESVRNAFLTPLPATPPLLNIQFNAPTNVVLSWWTNFTGFTLEANTNLLNTNVWSTVSPAPAVSGTNNVVTNAASGPARFYRLRN